MFKNPNWILKYTSGNEKMIILKVYIERWKVWQEQSVNRRIFAAMVTVGALTLVVKLISTAKELFVANQFGTGDALDAFLIAFLLPSIAVNVVAASLNLAFIPIYVHVREHAGREAAQRLFSGVMFWSTVLLMTVSILLAIIAPYILPIIGSGFSQEKLALTISLFYFMLPVLVISGFSTIWAAVLNAGGRFALAAVAPIMTPIVTVIVLLAMGNVWGVYSLAIGVVVGCVLEAGLIAWSLKRQQLSITPHWCSIDSSIRQVMNQYAPMAASAILTSSTSLVNQSMAAMLGPGSVATLNYGNRIVAGVLGIGFIALSTSVFPHFSEMVAIGDRSGVRHTLKTYVRLILVVTIPLTFILVYFSEPLVGIIFERGAFTEADTHLVGQLQALYALQIPFYLLGILLVRLVSSLNGNRIIMFSAIISLPLNIILNYMLMRYMGVLGIALSTVLVYAFSLGFIAVMLPRTMRGLSFKYENQRI